MLKKNIVVGDKRLNEQVVVGIFASAEVSVDKQTLYPRVPYTSGIAGQIDALRAVVNTPDASAEYRKLILGKLCRLVNGYYVIFLPLVSENVSVGGAIAEEYLASVGN